MPLIIVSGLPSSGKTHRARQLYDYLSEKIASLQSTTSSTEPAADQKKPAKQFRLHFVSDDTQSISRTVYDLSAVPAHTRSANASEKNARANLYGAVKRVLSDRDIVILDSGNYIKGWRYQLHCEAKEVLTPSVILQIGCPPSRAKAVNEARLRKRAQKTGASSDSAVTRPAAEDTGSAETGPDEIVPDDDFTLDDNDDTEPYEPANWENLVFRYEEPNPMTRWDSPLFPIIWGDGPEQTRKLFDELWEAIAGSARKTVRANQATVQRSRETGGDYLYTLDRETQDIVKRILEGQPEDGGGGSVSLARGPDTKQQQQQKQQQLVVELPGKKLGLPQLQRLRRAFVQLNRGGIGLEAVGSLSIPAMREAFVSYLNNAFENDE